MNTDETFPTRGLASAFCDWHAIRVWDLKYMKAIFTKAQVGEPGTPAYITKELKLLRTISPDTTTHYDKLRQHAENIGEAHIVKLARYHLSMRKKADSPLIHFPEGVRATKARRRAFTIAVREYIAEKSVKPYGDGATVGTDPKKPFACNVCRAASFELRSEREAHLAKCLALY
jgi:hypothetical protein